MAQDIGRRCWGHMGNIGTLVIRIGFWWFLIILIVEYTPNPILIIKAPFLKLVLQIRVPV